MQFDPASMNKRVQIQSQTTTQDSFGQELETWTTTVTCWAHIDIQQSALIYSTAEFISNVVSRLTFRWSSTVILTPNMRIVYTEPTTNVTHTYVIKALTNPQESNWYVVALCYELDAAQ
jgi:SPP1 family predicted phage head-tail adaptor